MVREALVIQHDIVGPRNGNDKVHPCIRQTVQQKIHVILVGLGMVGVTDITAHRHAQKLAAEMVLKPRTDDLLAVVEILRSDKAHDGVHQQTVKGAGNRIGTYFHGLLVDAMVTVRRQGRALPRLKIHRVLAHRAASERTGGVLSLAQDRQRDAKACICRLRPRNGLKHQIDRRTKVDRLNRGRHMAKHAGLNRQVIGEPQLVQQPRGANIVADAIGGWINADHSIARTIDQPIDSTDRNAQRIVSRMVGLIARRDRPRQTHRGAKRTHHIDLARHIDQIGVAHELADGSDHVRRQAPSEGVNGRAICAQKPFAKRPHSQGGDRRKGIKSMLGRNQIAHLIGHFGHKSI